MNVSDTAAISFPIEPQETEQTQRQVDNTKVKENILPIDKDNSSSIIDNQIQKEEKPINEENTELNKQNENEIVPLDQTKHSFIPQNEEKVQDEFDKIVSSFKEI